MEASFGNILLVFTPIGAEGVFRTLLDTPNFSEAERMLTDADDARLRALLAGAEPWR